MKNAKLQSLLDAGTSVVCDARDRLGLQPLVLSTTISSIRDRPVRFAGHAFTIQGAAASYEQSSDPQKLAAIDHMTDGSVALWAGSDIEGVCCFGDLLAAAMQARGCEGAVVDGGVRDVGYLRESNFPVYARYRSPAQSIGRWRVTSYQTPVKIRGALSEWVTVSPGDGIVVDEDGVTVVPEADLDKVCLEVKALVDSEQDARREIRGGMPLLKALEQYGHL